MISKDLRHSLLEGLRRPLWSSNNDYYYFQIIFNFIIWGFGLAILGGRVFASGMFGDKSVTKSQSSYLVRWQSGSWESLQGGVGGPVFTMLAMDSCLYVGGLFDSVGGMDEISGIKVHNAARWCFDRNGRVESKWSAVQWPNDQIGVCRVIKSS